MVQVYGGPCTVIFTARMNHCRVPETPQIFSKRFLAKCGLGKSKKPRFEPKLGAVANHCFRKRSLLNQKEPMKTRRRPFLGHVVKELIGWDNVENSDFCDATRVIQSHSVGYSSAAIMAHYRKFLKPQAGHHFHLVLRRRTFRISKMIFPVRGFAAVPVTAEIGCNHRKLLGQLRRNFAPLDVRLRITVEKQKARSVPAGDKVDRGARGFRRKFLEPRKKISVGRLL